MIELNFTFDAKLWLYTGKAAWHFVTVPKEISDNIKFMREHIKRGWGSHRVKVKIGEEEWNTSIFPDSKADAYLLPIKATIRKKARLRVGDVINISLTVLK